MNAIGGMEPMSEKHQSEVERNFAAFQEKLPELMATHPGKIAVMHRGEIEGFFDTVSDAVQFGLSRFGALGAFSIQEITSKNINLGYHAYAMFDLPH